MKLNKPAAFAALVLTLIPTLALASGNLIPEPIFWLILLFGTPEGWSV